MRKNKGKILSILIMALSIISIEINAYAHSGRTDSSGGHKDNKNKSGLGSYHYHCGGYSAHLHTNGVCPYSSSKTSTSKESTTKSKTITATSVEINEKFNSMNVGDSKDLTVTITPSNVSNKNITWKSSNLSIATVSNEGKVQAKKPGIVEITATTSNGKTNKITIDVIEDLKEEKIVTTNSPSMNNTVSNSKTNTIANSNEDLSALGGAVTLGLLGGGGYLLNKKHKKN